MASGTEQKQQNQYSSEPKEKIVDSRLFEFCTGLIIAANIALIGVEAEMSLGKSKTCCGHFRVFLHGFCLYTYV